MSTRVYAAKDQWKLVSSVTCDYQVEGENVECWFTEDASTPTGDPPRGRIARTVDGNRPYHFESVAGRKLWAWAKRNGATIIVDERSSATLSEHIRTSGVTAFGEIKVAEVDMIAAWLFPYNINSELIVSTEENGGTVTHAGSFAVIQSGTATDGRARIETRKALRYQTGIGGIVRFTAIFTQGVADSHQMVGIMGGSTDGLLFGYSGTQFGAIRRNDGSEHFIPVSEWSEGVFEGFDPTKLNVYQIQFQWLGGGEIRYYVEDPEVGSFVLVHRIKIANSGVDVSLQNPSLPIVAEVLNEGNDTNLTVSTPSASAGIEGNSMLTALSITRSADAELEGVSTTLVPIVSIMNPTTYESLPNRLTLRATLLSTAVASATLTRRATLRVLRNASLTDASFAAVDATATPAQVDTAATAVTGGTQQFAATYTANNDDTVDLESSDITIRPGETLTIAAIATGSVDVSAGVTFKSEV